VFEIFLSANDAKFSQIFMLSPVLQVSKIYRNFPLLVVSAPTVGGRTDSNRIHICVPKFGH